MTLTRLQPGMRVRIEGRVCQVRLVNESRAVVAPEGKKTRVVRATRGPNAGKEVVFQEDWRPLSISPNSECVIL